MRKESEATTKKVRKGFLIFREEETTGDKVAKEAAKSSRRGRAGNKFERIRELRLQGHRLPPEWLGT